MKPEDFLLFNETLRGAVKAGAPLPEGLEAFARELGRGPADSVLAVAADLRQGLPLSEALERQGKVFPRVYVRLVQAGEKAGNLEAVLQRVLEAGREAVRLRNAVEEAFAYPFVLCIVLAVVHLLWALAIAPQMGRAFSEMYGEMGFRDGLPLPTQVSLWMMEHGVWTTGVPLTALVVALLLFRGLSAGWIRVGPALERLLTWLPPVGGMLQAGTASRFCHAAGLLLERGVPAPEALALSAEASGSAWMAEDLTSAEDQSRRGANFADALHAFQALPPVVLWMVRQGEGRGDLAGTLDQLGRLYLDVALRRMRLLRSTLLPLLLMLMGLWVGFTVVSMFLPLVQMMGMIGA